MKLKLLILSLCILSLCRCSDLNDDNIMVDNEKLEIRVGSSLSGTVTNTRASGTMWENADEIGVYVVKDGGTLTNATDVLYDNSKYLYDTSPSWTTTTGYQAFKYSSGQKPLYPVDDSQIQMVAYYPYNSAWSASATKTLNVATQTSQQDIDLLYAPVTTGTHKKSLATTPIDLNFTHKLSKLIIQVKAGTDVTNAEAAAVVTALKNFVTDGTFAIATGTVTTGTTTGNITPMSSATIPTGVDAQFEAILIPQTLSSETVEFTIGTDVFVWDLTATTGTNLTQLEEGKKYSYVITINRKGILVDGKITDWATGTSGEGDAE